MRHAPSGGIAQRGQWYEGGQFLPEEEMLGRSRIERVRKGDIRSFRCGDLVRYMRAGAEVTGVIAGIDWRNGYGEVHRYDAGGRKIGWDDVPLRELVFIE